MGDELPEFGVTFEFVINVFGDCVTFRVSKLALGGALGGIPPTAGIFEANILTWLALGDNYKKTR